jgi:hypothetical protein
MAEDEGLLLEDRDRRTGKDRRRKPTPALSRYTLLGRRRRIRRKSDQERGGYIDHYSGGLFIALILIASLNILDSFFTILVLNDGGWEVNPIVRSVIESCGNGFWVWKFSLVSFSLILLALHSNFGHVRTAIHALCFIYVAVVLYQIFLITGQLPEMP